MQSHPLLVGSQLRYFTAASSSSSDDASDDQTDAAAAATTADEEGHTTISYSSEGSEQDSTANNSPKEESSQLTTQYHLVPMRDHPVFPGSSMATSLTKEQFDMLQDVKTVFVSVVQNDEMLRSHSLMDSLEHEQGGQHSSSQIPEIKKQSDVYWIGSIAAAKAIHDSSNPFLPYYLNLFPREKAMITGFIDDKVKPLCRVTTVPVFYNNGGQELSPEDELTLKFMRKSYSKIIKIAPDDKFKEILMFLERQFGHEDPTSFLHMVLTTLAMPQYANTYRFLINVDRHKLQAIYSEPTLKTALQQSNDILQDFISKLSIWSEMEKQHEFRSDQAKTQKKYQEIFESLKSYFNQEPDEKQQQVKQFLKDLEGKEVPDHIMKTINEELQKFLQMDKHSSEMQVTRNYLDYLTKMPYGVSSEENFDLNRAREILNEGHYGLDDVKQRILEFIAVGKLHNSVQGKILCFVGPPGVGKTSIGQSIADSLGRKFIRISLGGASDTSTLKGHRRTYVGAVPGKIVKALKTAEVENPVILIDEVDKIGVRSAHGDPGSALLEILDPEQNKAFTDDYLDVPIDLSKVLFVCTANDLSQLHPAVLDRMEIIELAGYTHIEKLHILDNYLYPEAIKAAGLAQYMTNIRVPSQVRNYIIENYAREPGVRSLKKFINKICEKIAFKIVDKQSSGESLIDVEQSDLEDFIGPPIFSSRKIYDVTPPGVVTGLAYNSIGGGILFIEATQASFPRQNNVSQPPARTPDGSAQQAPPLARGSLRVTGSLGDVMKESSQIAMTFAKSFVYRNFSSDAKIAKNDSNSVSPGDFLESKDIHVHFPEGATPKDGPSAGIAITTSLVGLAIGEPCIQGLGMTGEISLNGKVLKIGGVKEKTMAAVREGLTTLIFPAGNRADVERLPDYVKENVKFHFVENYDQVFKIAYPDVKL